MTFFLNPKSNDKSLLQGQLREWMQDLVTLRAWKKQSAVVAPVRESGDRDDEKQVVNETGAKPDMFDAAAGDLDNPIVLVGTNPYEYKPKPTKPKPTVSYKPMSSDDSDPDVVEIPKPKPKTSVFDEVADVTQSEVDAQVLDDQAYAVAISREERETELSATGLAATARDDLLSPSPERPDVLLEDDDVYDATNPRRSSRLVGKPRPIQLDHEQFPEVAEEQWNKYLSIY